MTSDDSDQCSLGGMKQLGSVLLFDYSVDGECCLYEPVLEYIGSSGGAFNGNFCHWLHAPGKCLADSASLDRLWTHSHFPDVSPRPRLIALGVAMTNIENTTSVDYDISESMQVGRNQAWSYGAQVDWCATGICSSMAVQPVDICGEMGISTICPFQDDLRSRPCNSDYILYTQLLSGHAKVKGFVRSDGDIQTRRLALINGAFQEGSTIFPL
jgi:hypothetical protein